MAGNIRNTLSVINTVISEIADKENFHKFNIEIKPISSNGANFMGDLFLVDIEESEKETLKLFAKAANTSEEARETIPANMVYKREVFVYTTLAKTFYNLQEKHNIPKEKQFKFAKYYGSNLNDMEEVLVLEDLTSNGYVLRNRLVTVDWEYTKAAIEEIAKFHALSFTLEKEDPEQFKTLISDMRHPMNENMDVYITMVKQFLPHAIRSVEPENREKIQKYVDKNKNSFFKNQINPLSKYSTLIHGDYRVSNILVKYKGDAVTSLIPVDYQASFFGCPVTDIIYFLFTGSDADFRQRHFEDYLMHYHDSLTAHLSLLSQDIDHIYPRSHFYADVADKLIFGLDLSLFTLGGVLMAPSQGIAADDILNVKDGSKVLNKGDLYATRLNEIVRDFVRWGYLTE